MTLAVQTLTADPVPVRDNFGMTAAERYGHGRAYGFIIVSERDGRVQHGTTYYANEADAVRDAAWYARFNLPGTSYRVERVVTAECGLTHCSRIPELEAARAFRRSAQQRATAISRLVKRGVPYGEAIAAAQKIAPLARGKAVAV